MKNLKKILAVVLIVAMVFSFGACGSSDNGESVVVPEFSIEVAGVDGVEVIDQDTLEGLTLQTKEIIMTKSDGSETGGEFEGYLLKDVFAAAGIEGYTNVSVEASDGYAKDYDAATVDADDTLLTISENGEELISVIAGSQSASAWIKDLAKFTVTK